MRQRLGVLVVGQAPRPDGMASDVRAILGDAIDVIEAGILDGLTGPEIEALAPGPDEYRVVTIMPDGSWVKLSRDALLDLAVARVAHLEQVEQVNAIVIMGTGQFPAIPHQRPLLRPQRALYGAVIGMAAEQPFAAMTPLPEQIKQSYRQWQEWGISNVVVVAANAYAADASEQVASAARQARVAGARLLFMENVGYTRALKAIATEAFGGPVILARSLITRMAAELLD